MQPYIESVAAINGVVLQPYIEAVATTSEVRCKCLKRVVSIEHGPANVAGRHVSSTGSELQPQIEPVAAINRTSYSHK